MKNTFTLNAQRLGLKLTTLLFTLLLICGQSWGQVGMTTTGSHTQNFDALANTGTANAWTNNSTIANWYSQRTGTGTTYAADAGTATAGNLYSYGSVSTTERALGSLGSGNTAAGHFAHGVLLRNTSGTAITDIKVTYTLEQWRLGVLGTANIITFWYKISSSPISALNPNSNSTWTQVTGLSLTSPVTSGTVGALNGNTSTNRVTATNVTIPGLSLANDDYIMLKWEDPDHSGTDQGLAIDDVTINWTVASVLNPPTLTASTSPTSVDNSFTVTYPTDAAYQTAISSGTITIGAATLVYGTDYTLSGDNTITFFPSVSGNSYLRTPGTYTITVNATGYNPATVSQQLTAGVPTSNSTATINLPLAAGTARQITCTAKDQYNNLVSGYTFKLDVTITDNDITLDESYAVDYNAITTTTYDISMVATTDANGVAQFFVELPALIDGGDGISIQVQLNDGTTNIGPLFSYIQLQSQIITFGALTPVTYGDAPFTVSATGGGSGNPVIFTSSDTTIATCTGTNGSTITIIGPGTCTIYANQAGNASYNDAIQVGQSLVVNTKSLTIPDAVAQNKTYTGTNAAVITGTLTGFIGADVVTHSGTGTFATVDVATGIAVTSTITLGGADAIKYNLIQPTGLFADITQATQIITFATLISKEIGSAPFSLNATASSGLPVSYTSSDTSVATVAGNIVTVKNLGTTIITASQAGDANYLPALDVQQPLSVVPAVLVAWQFSSPASSGFEATYNATTNNAMLNTSVLARGGGISPTALTRGFSANNWDVNGTKASALFYDEYFQFTISTQPHHIVSLSGLDAKIRVTSTAPNTYIWQYSTDGANFYDIGSDISIASSTDGLIQPTIDLSGIPALQNVTDATTITFRLYAWGGTSTTATVAFARYAAGVTTNCLAISGEALCPTPAAPVFALGATSSRCQGAGTVSYSATSTNSYAMTYSLDAASLAGGNTIVTNTGVVTYNAIWSGTSIITAVATGCNGTDTSTHTVTVNVTPSAVTITPASATICGSDIQILEASGGLVYASNNVLLNETFNAPNDPPTGWQNINNSTGGIPDTAAWTLQPDGYINNAIWHSNDNSQFYLSNSNAQGYGGNTSTVLVSKSFSTVGFFSASLNFYQYFYSNTTLTAKVDYSTDGSNWINLKTFIDDIGTPYGFVQDISNLPGGEPVMYVRFTLDGEFGYFWAIDNVSVTGASVSAPITWSPIGGLYTDPGAGTGTEYTGGATTTVYAKPNVTTTYTATATAGNACSNSTSVIITVNSLPIATFSYTGTPYCSNQANPSPSFDPGAGPGSFSASPAGLSINTTTGQVDLLASAAGTYTVTNTIAASGGCPPVIATSSITVTTAPTANISYSGSPYCTSVTSATVTISGTGSYLGGSFTSLPTGLSIDGGSGEINPSLSTAGTYDVTYTIPAGGGGCSSISVTTQVTITTLPIAGFSYIDSPYCSDGSNPSPTFSVGGEPGIFSSSAGLAFANGYGQVSLAGSIANSYTVTNTIAAAGGCPQVVATSPITITSSPVATISYSVTPLCTSEGVQPVILSGTSGGTFTATPAGLSIDPGSGTITPGSSNAGTYTVTYTIPTIGGCSGITATTQVIITVLPIATFSYTGSPYLSSGTDPLPTLDGLAGVFSASPAGLVFISTATGEVDLSASTIGTYTVTNTVAAAGGCAEVTASATITINTPAFKTLNVTVLIEGLYVGGGLMHEAYDYDDVLGLVEKWGTGIADTVTVVLYDNSYGNIVARYPGVYLNTSGLLTIPTVNASLGNDYYITIFHRNSMAITTATAQSFAGTTINYNFTTPADQAYGVGSQKALVGGLYGMYTGELDHDTYYFIDGDDNTIMEPAVILSALGYLLEDLNGSGYVDGDDNVIMEPNVIISPYFQNPLTAKKKHAPKIQYK